MILNFTNIYCDKKSGVINKDKNKKEKNYSSIDSKSSESLSSVA